MQLTSLKPPSFFHSNKVWHAAQMACLEIEIVCLRPLQSKYLDGDRELSGPLGDMHFRGVFANQTDDLAVQDLVLNSSSLGWA